MRDGVEGEKGGREGEKEGREGGKEGTHCTFESPGQNMWSTKLGSFFLFIGVQ